MVGEGLLCPRALHKEQILKMIIGHLSSNGYEKLIIFFTIPLTFVQKENLIFFIIELLMEFNILFITTILSTHVPFFS